MGKLQVEVTFLLNSAFHSSSDRGCFGVDKTTYLKPGTQSAAIPATLLKGAFREQVERVLRSFDVDVCQSPRPDDICNRCIVCEMFGSPKQKSKLVFEDAKVEDSAINVKPGVGIDRRRRVAKEDHLFSQEVAWGRRFTSMIRGLFPSRDDALKGCGLLFTGASLFVIGGGKSRGQGWLKFERFVGFIDGTEVAREEINQAAKKVLGFG